MALHNELVKWGEDLACEKLIADGCAIMERNWRMGHYELDIVAMKDDRVIFAEVKTRSDYNCDPLEAVDKKKIARIVASANTYMISHGLHHDAQFDLFAIAGTPDCYKLEHIPDAFLAPLKTY
jgi:putative endonuclease